MKKLLRKNQIIITALVIMVAVAGYLSLSQDSDSLLTLTEHADVSENLNEGTDITDGDIKVAEEGEEDCESASPSAVKTKETAKNNAGEAVMVGSTVQASYFESAKLAREQTRAKNKETLLELVNHSKATEQQKENAMNQIMNMTQISEKETATENLLAAKGFSDVVVSIVDDSVDVIVNAEDLNTKQIAQIEDIVKRKTEIQADKIVISPVGKKK